MLKRNNKNLRPITPVRSINGATFLPAVKSLHPLDPIPPIGYKSDAIVYGVNAMSLQPEAANSFADIITGGPLGTSQLRRTLDKNNLGFFKEIPLLNKVVGALALSKNQFIDPVFDKGMSQGGKEVFLNVLTNASETLDLFSNLIKSQWELAGGHAGLDTLASAWGVGEHNTRKVYNFNTGNFLGDVALEVISDPVNWVSLGAKALAGTTIKAGTDVIEETVEATVKNNVDDLSKILLKDLSKEAVDDFSERLTKEITEQIIKQETKDITFDSLKYFLKETTVQEFEEASQALLKAGANSGIFEATVKEALEKSITASSKLFHAYNAANAFKEFFKKNVEDTLSHLAYAPVYYPYKGLKKFIESNEVLRNFAKRIHNKLVSFLDEYTKKNDIVDVEKVYTHSSADAFVESENYFGKLISDNKPLLEKLGVSAYTLQEEWLAMLRTLTRDQMHTGIDELRTMFIRWLALHRNPAIKEMSLTVAEKSFLNQMSVAPLIIR